MDNKLGSLLKVPTIKKSMAKTLLRYLVIILFTFTVFGLVLFITGKNPIRAYADTFTSIFGSFYGFSELWVQMIPIMLTAVAVALPSKMNLINVGGEGQLFMGGWLATWAALTFQGLPKVIFIPVLMLFGFLGGALWAAIPGLLKAKKLVNETISTLLLNFIAPLIISLSVFGPWRSAESAAYPQTPAFVDAARLPVIPGTRIHLGFIFAIVALLLFWFFMKYTKWGLEIRAIGGNPEAAERMGIRLQWYILFVLCIGGGIAGLAGMAEVTAIHGRLRIGLSQGYGYKGFLLSWVTGGSPIGILLMAFVFAVITSVGDTLQITQGVPYAVINILFSLILFVVLANPVLKGK
jgi:simple sugar transport system permease protein